MADVFTLLGLVIVVLTAVVAYICIQAERNDLKELGKQAEREDLEAAEKLSLAKLADTADYIQMINDATTTGELDRLSEERKKQLCSGLPWPSSCLQRGLWQ